MIRVILLALTMLPASPTAQTAGQGPAEALDGIDPVVLIQTGKEVQGKPEFTVVRGRFEYAFSSADTKATFEKTPEKYEIQLGGACARMGPAAGGNPADYLVHDGRIYIFGSDDCHKKFAAAPDKYLPRPAPPMTAASAAARQGRVLIDRAVKAIGGAAHLDTLTSYVETSTQLQKRAQGDASITTKTSWRFPDSVRSDRSMTVQGKTMSSATLITPAGAWFIGGSGQVFPARPDGRESMEQEFARRIVPLLRARQSSGFKAAALESATVDGVKVERVRIIHRGVDVTVGLDASSGRVHSIAFVGRNNEGQLGETTMLYSDYRNVDGLMIPFSERALFDGAPDEFHTRRLDSISINAPLEPKLFEPGSAGGL